MAEHRAAIAGTLNRTADPGDPEDPTPAPRTVRGLALRLAFWVVIAVGVIYTSTIDSWRHHGLLSLTTAFWVVVTVNAIWQAWRRFEELRDLRSRHHVLPH